MRAQEQLYAIYTDAEKSRLCKLRMLCSTLAGNIVYLLTITEPRPPAQESAAQARPRTRPHCPRSPIPFSSPSHSHSMRRAGHVTREHLGVSWELITAISSTHLHLHLQHQLSIRVCAAAAEDCDAVGARAPRRD